MKKMVGLICLMFVLVSCGSNELVKSDTIVDNNIKVNEDKEDNFILISYGVYEKNGWINLFDVCAGFLW